MIFLCWKIYIKLLSFDVFCMSFLCILSSEKLVTLAERCNCSASFAIVIRFRLSVRLSVVWLWRECALTLCLSSLMTEFEGSPLDLGLKVRWGGFYPKVKFGYLLSQFRFSVNCNVRAPCSARWNIPQCFYAILYHGHPLTSTQNFTGILPSGLVG